MRLHSHNLSPDCFTRHLIPQPIPVVDFYDPAITMPPRAGYWRTPESDFIHHRSDAQHYPAAPEFQSPISNHDTRL